MSTWQDEIIKTWTREKGPKKFILSDAVRDRLAREFKGEVLYKEPMSQHTSMRVGGPADVFLKPMDLNDFMAAVRIAQEEQISFTVIGSGSNTLVKDGGIRGFVIASSGALQECHFDPVSEEEGNLLFGGGVKITRAVYFAKENSLTGLEPLVGIPGTMGGAIMMNAGAHGVEIKDFIREVTFLRDGEVKVMPREKLEFDYRRLKIPKDWIVLSGLFRLKRGNAEEIKEKTEHFQKWRVEKQPLQYPNLGSIFKNPLAPKKGKVLPSAGQLIEESGLKNVRVGGARISEKHANFIINENKAKAKDVLILINLIRDKIKETTGIVLETEVRVIGEDSPLEGGFN